jgi:hypothetical protein
MRVSHRTTFAYTLAVAPAGSALLLVITMPCGLYWSVLRAWTGSLAPVLVCHLVWDLFVFVLPPLAPPPADTALPCRSKKKGAGDASPPSAPRVGRTPPLRDGTRPY